VANLEFKSCKMVGMATSVPEMIRSTESFSSFIGEEGVKKFIKNVGMKQGHISSPDMTTSDLCFSAANQLLDRLNIDRNSIDVLLFVSQTPDYVAPSTACVLQYRLDLSQECLAFDINLACSGFVYGTTIASSYLQTKGVSRVLLLCGDTVSKHCSPLDRGLTMLSADAGSAILMEKAETAKDISKFKLRTIGESYRSLIVPAGGYRHRERSFARVEREPGVVRSDFDGYMNGAEVFRFSITEVPQLIKSFYQECNVNPDVIDNFFMHQANLFILKNIAKRSRIPEAKMPISIDRYGNTGAATVPLTMCDHYARQREAKVNESILVCGFGIGLSLGVGVLRLEDCLILPISIARDSYTDNIENLHNESTSFVG